MNKENLLKMLAESGYNLGYGAKKHFATFDLIEKMPGWLSFAAFVVGIYALFMPVLATNQFSAAMILFGIASLYISAYNAEKQKYEEGGKHLTGCYNKLLSKTGNSTPSGSSFILLSETYVNVAHPNSRRQNHLPDRNVKTNRHGCRITVPFPPGPLLCQSHRSTPTAVPARSVRFAIRGDQPEYVRPKLVADIGGSYCFIAGL